VPVEDTALFLQSFLRPPLRGVGGLYGHSAGLAREKNITLKFFSCTPHGAWGRLAPAGCGAAAHALPSSPPA